MQPLAPPVGFASDLAVFVPVVLVILFLATLLAVTCAYTCTHTRWFCYGSAALIQHDKDDGTITTIPAPAPA